MADATGKWDAATLSTVASISRIEREITQLIGVGNATYSVQDVDVSGAITPDSIDISEGKGILEIIAIAETECSFDGFSIKLQDSDDDSTFADFGTGLVIYGNTGTVAAGTILSKFVIPDNMQDYMKPKITIGTSTGTISIYANSKYDDKITLAKEMLGDDAAEMLINNQLLTFLDTTDNVLDCIYTPADLELVSDLLVLSLIYQDLARGAEDDSRFWQKCKQYRKDYREHFSKKFKLMTIDIDQTGDSLVYYSQMNYISQAGR